MSYKDKYIKYKIKYINLKNNMKAGGLIKFEGCQLLNSNRIKVYNPL